jgi:hypothetical protein
MLSIYDHRNWERPLLYPSSELFLHCLEYRDASRIHNRCSRCCSLWAHRFQFASRSPINLPTRLQD